jgi:hypothetical protein
VYNPASVAEIAQVAEGDAEDINQAVADKGDPKVQKILAQQEAALQGKQGALLLVIDVKTGLTKATKKLPALPVWDSLAVANGKLFYTTQTGEVICLGE